MRGWGACMVGGGWVCMVARGHAWLQGGGVVCVDAGGVHDCWGACLVVGGHVWLWGGVCVVGGMHGHRGHAWL